MSCFVVIYVINCSNNPWQRWLGHEKVWPIELARWTFLRDITSLLRNPEPNWSSGNNSEFTDTQELWACCAFGKYITCGIARVLRASVLFLSWPITQEHGVRSALLWNIFILHRWDRRSQGKYRKSDSLSSNWGEIILTFPTVYGQLLQTGELKK